MTKVLVLVFFALFAGVVTLGVQHYVLSAPTTDVSHASGGDPCIAALIDTSHYNAAKVTGSDLAEMREACDRWHQHHGWP